MTMPEWAGRTGWDGFRLFCGFAGLLVLSVGVAAAADSVYDFIPESSWNKLGELGPEAGEILLKGAILTTFAGLLGFGALRVAGVHWPSGGSSDH